MTSANCALQPGVAYPRDYSILLPPSVDLMSSCSCDRAHRTDRAAMTVVLDQGGGDAEGKNADRNAKVSLGNSSMRCGVCQGSLVPGAPAHNPDNRRRKLRRIPSRP